MNEEGITPEERREKAKHIEVKLQQAQIEALRAAQLELLRARRERDITYRFIEISFCIRNCYRDLNRRFCLIDLVRHIQSLLFHDRFSCNRVFDVARPTIIELYGSGLVVLDLDVDDVRNVDLASEP